MFRDCGLSDSVLENHTPASIHLSSRLEGVPSLSANLFFIKNVIRPKISNGDRQASLNLKFPSFPYGYIFQSQIRYMGKLEGVLQESLKFLPRGLHQKYGTMLRARIFFK